MCANTAIITVSPAPLTPSEASRAVVRLLIPSARTSSKTWRCHARTSSLVADSSSGDKASRRWSASSERPEGSSRQLRAARSAARSAAASTTASTLVSTAASSSPAVAGRPVTSERKRSRTQPTRASSARIRSPVPITSCQRASTSPRRSEPLRTTSSTSSSARRYDRRASARSSSATARCSASAASTTPTRAGTVSSAPVSVLPDQRLPARRVGGQSVEPAPHRLELGRRDQPVLERSLPDDEQLRVVEPALAEHLAQVVGDLGDGVGRDAVEHDRERGAALARALEQLPRHRVRVARGGRDEEPGVRGGEQLRAERAVLGDDGVDVRGVEQSQPRGQTLGRREHELGRAACTAGRPREPRQHALVLEPADVARVAGEQRAAASSGAGRRPRSASSPTTVFTSVDLPAPVEPPTTISSGASICRSRGSR